MDAAQTGQFLERVFGYGMRWDAQRLDVEESSALPGMPSIRGLLRSVQVPEFPGLTFHEVRSKSALNHVPEASAMPFPYTINPYRGCSHSCTYCFARKTHEWLEMDSGHDFDSQIVVKTNLVDVLRKELARPSWKREHALSAPTPTRTSGPRAATG